MAANERKILVAVDGSPSSLMALDYLGMMVDKVLGECRVTLFHVAAYVPAILSREATVSPAAEAMFRQLSGRARQGGSHVLEVSMQRLSGQGFPEDHIETRLHTRSMGLAKDILYEAERGGYHALLLGRRGLTGTEGLFLGGVTNKVVQHAERVPVWVVGEQINSHRILCAVECSGGAMRVVQYLSSMLGGGEHCTVTLFHVGDKLNGTSRDENQGQWQGSDLESFYPDDLESVWEEEAFDVLSQERQRSLADFGQQARGLLEESGLRPDQIQVMYVADRYGVAEGILKELDTGKYGTVVLGRRGEGQSYWLGHTSDLVLNRCRGAAVWLVG